VSERPKTVAAIGLLVLLVGAWFLIDAAGNSRLRRAKAAILAREEPLTVDDLRERMPSIRDDQNMAIGLMEHGAAIQASTQSDAALFNGLPIYGNAKLVAIGVRCVDDQLIASRQFLDMNRAALDGIAQATELGDGVYPIVWKQPAVGVLLPQLSMHRGIVKSLALAALVSAHDGHAEDSVRLIAQAAAADRALRHDPILVSVLVRMACQSLVLDTALRSVALTQFTDSQLRELNAAICSFADETALRNAMLGERVLMLDTITWAYADGNLSGLVARSAPPGALLKLAPGVKSVDPAVYLEQMARICDAVTLPPATAVAEVGKLEQGIADLPFYAVMAKMLTPSMSRSVSLWYRSRAMNGATRAALAAERYRLAYGNWPSGLGALVPEFLSAEAIVDPFSGAALIYHRDADGIRVYSVGEDGVDEDGNTDRPRSNKQREMFDPGVFLPNPDRRNLAASTQAAGE